MLLASVISNGSASVLSRVLFCRSWVGSSNRLIAPAVIAIANTQLFEPAIAHLLENPRIFNDLEITPVKTFKDGTALGKKEHVLSDI